ncbi:SGNH/GDSL hydrolase family protein [Dysgonomonas sp. Marseille-P4677]|uniref:SGNH/GDSL hydrolase family protein n=1 Tax=Dysgonomonas sp. Marseille-P4677 TaxID=2364790 RepID=UPI00191191F2|nr:SGNH/GDSL hydrolase family protein [Dysgonomonas sp. Marseille-P4677]MBK5722943.1 SGNH/GDSL hydrolase family protein [Dysgonomonas sp. Marseille-P4677]
MKKIILLILLVVFSLVVNAQKFNELINLNKYAKANSELPLPGKKENRVVFIGNSITEGWANMRPDFFSSNNYIGRGISGQTSPQLLSRFRQDVINLHPVAVVINIGTNDIAENTGTYDPEFTLGNIKSMAELAKANNIKVILSSVLPVGEYPWRKEIKNVPDKIAALNKGIEEYAKKNKFAYIDYFAVMHDENRALISTYGDDGVHPNALGYEVMEKTAKAVLNKVVK